MKGYKFFIAFILFFCLFINKTQGQDFEVAPVLVNFTANPGESQNKILTVRNHSPERQKFTLNLSDYLLNESGDKVQKAAGTTERTLFNWLTINPSFITLNPNESAEVELIMNVPRDGFNTRWGIIHVQVAKEQTPASADKQLATGVIIVPRIVVLLKQSPKANQNYSAKISTLKEITEPGDENKSFEAVISNTGDKVIDAKVFLALANLETAEEQKFKPRSFTVYPGFERKVTLKLPVELQKGSYALAILMDYGKNTAIEGAQLLLEIE